MQKLAMLLTAAIFTGCATAPTQQATHYWESDRSSANRYRVDQQSCQRDAGGTDSGQPAFDADSGSYQAYRDCMVSKGYVLRQY